MHNENKDYFAHLRETDYVLWGTGRIAQAFYQKYCVDRKQLQEPLYWCDNAAAV